MKRAHVTPLAALCLSLALAPGGAGHELEENRATLVMRAPQHLSLTLYLSYTEVLHRAMAPDKSIQEFLLACSALKVEELDKQLKQVQARFEAGTRVQLEPGGEAAPANWAWPSAAEVQTAARRRVMELVTATGGHSHEAPVEVRADVTGARAIVSARIRFPAEFQRVLVVAYRPAQFWVEAQGLSPAIPF